MTLKTYQGTFDQQNAGFQDFLSKNPDIDIVWPSCNFHDNASFLSALISNALDADLLSVSYNHTHTQKLFSKGFCMDLSQSAILSSLVKKIYPSIQKLIMYEGKVYGIPHSVSFPNPTVNIHEWKKLQLTDADIPKTAESFLDFLENHIAYYSHEAPSLRCLGDSDWSTTDYRAWILNKIILEIQMQAHHAGMPLHFDASVLKPLFERAMEIAYQLYQLEGDMTAPALFVDTGDRINWTPPQQLLSFRLHRQDPTLIKGYLSFWSINKKSNHAEDCIRLLEHYQTGTTPGNHPEVFLFQDAVPIENPEYAALMDARTQEITQLQAQLDALPSDSFETRSIKNQLSLAIGQRSTTENQRWVMSQSDLCEYQNMQNNLVFLPPNLFSEGDTQRNYQQLLQQVCAEQISVDSFLQALNQIVRLYQLEQGL